MTVENLYQSYKKKLKEDPNFELIRCQYTFGGKIILKVTKRNGYHIHTRNGVIKVSGTAKIS